MSRNQSVQSRTRAALYVRVSSDEQAKGYSLAFQQEEVVGFIERNGATLDKTHVYVDGGYTGIHGHRPALQAMIAAAEDRQFDRVYVWKIDRLYRNTKLVLQLVDDLAAIGVSVTSMSEPFCDSSTPTSRYMFTLLAAGAEMEHANINERTHQGKLRAMRDGKWLCGTPPYGYDLDPETSKLVINKEEAPWVRRFFEWLVQERLTLYALQQRVNTLGIRTKHANMGRMSKKTRKTFWNKRTLGRLLGHEIYTGVFYYRKYKKAGRVHGADNLRPGEDWIRIHPPAIIGADLHEGAARQLKLNQENSPRKTKRRYLFAKKLVCGACGHKINAAFRPPSKGTRQQGTKYYKGAWLHKGGTDRPCQNCRFYAEPRLDRALWSALKELLERPDIVMKRIASYQRKGKDTDDMVEEQKRLAERIGTVEEKEARLLNAYLEGDIDKKLYKSKHAELSGQQQALHERRRRLEQMVVSRRERARRVRSIQALYPGMKRILADASYEQRCAVMDFFVESVTLTGDKADVELAIPLEANTLAWLSGGKETAAPGQASELLRDKRRMDCPAKITRICLSAALPPGHRKTLSEIRRRQNLEYDLWKRNLFNPDGTLKVRSHRQNIPEYSLDRHADYFKDDLAKERFLKVRDMILSYGIFEEAIWKRHVAYYDHTLLNRFLLIPKRKSFYLAIRGTKHRAGDIPAHSDTWQTFFHLKSGVSLARIATLIKEYVNGLDNKAD